MRPEDEWDMIRNDRGAVLGGAGRGVLRVALLFGSAVVALAMILVPIADNYTRPQNADTGYGLDLTTTGSIRSGGTFTIRKSVLQSSPTSVCIIRENGLRSGDC